MWLIGMMGSGKTTVGKVVARRLQVPFYDSDEIVSSAAGTTISALWEEQGEKAFRDMETAAIAAAPSGVVAAAGGGAVLDAGNTEVMRRDPPIVWLRAPAATLAERIGAHGGRPLLARPAERVDVLRELLEAREDAYRAAATHIIDADRPIEEVAGEVSGLWPA